MIVATIRMTIPRQKRHEIVRMLKSAAELWRDVSGCLSCHIYEDVEDKNILMVEQVWRAEEELKHHIRSDDYRNLLLILEMALKPPEVRFDAIASSTGIETIEEVRGYAR